MRFVYLWIIFGLVPSATLWAKAQQVPPKALCPVCVLKGEEELEKVKAHSEHDGEMYYFCSKDCKKEFDSDPTAYLPPVLPRPAPAFTVESLKGEDVSLQDFKNKTVLIDFWATWCKPCLKTMPQLQQLYQSYADKGLVVLGISVDEDEDRIKKIKKWIDKMGISYPVFSDAKEAPAWHTFNVKAIPALFLVNKDGQIVAQWRGKIDHKQLKNEVIQWVEK
jgi:peroxiredoxin/YHS domain-containing protein